MESIRVSAKTVDDALTEASIELGTSRDNIEFTVIDEGSKGFFGIGGRKATIEARKKVTDEDLMKEIFEEKPQKPKKEPKREEKSEIKKDSKKESRNESKNGGKKEDSRDAGKALKKESKQDFKLEKKENKDQKKDQKKTEKKEEKREEKKAEKKEVRRESEASVRVKSSESGKETVVKEEAKSTMDEPNEITAVREDEEAKIPKTPADPEEAKQRAITFLSDVLQAMGMKDEITAEFEDDILCVNLEGEDMGIMIGKRGQTLDSLQYLTSLVVNKGKSSYTRVKVDTEDYRNRRKATLENLAKNIAMKVKKTRRPVFLEPMNPYERRIIHSALQNDPYVTTHSEGEEPYRKVVVTLKKDRDRDDRDHSRNRGYSKYGNNRRGRYERGNYNRRTYDRESFEAGETAIESEQRDFAEANDSLDQSEE